jgi:hypothetical protein
MTRARLHGLGDAQVVLDSMDSQIAALRVQPTLRGFTGFVPISGRTRMLDDSTVTDGVVTAQMVRIPVPIFDNVVLYAPVWSGWGMRQVSDPSGTVLYEGAVPNSVKVSASVETLDGRRLDLECKGSRRWTVGPWELVQSTPLRIDVPWNHRYFWLRVYVEVTTSGDKWYRNLYATNTVSGALQVKYAIDVTLEDYAAQVKALTPSLYWTLDSLTGATDQSGNSRNGTAQGGVGIGSAAGLFSEGATQGDGVDDRVTSTYNPYTNGQPLSVSGLTYLDNAVAARTLFGGDAGATQPVLRVNTSGATNKGVDFFPAAGSASANWPTVFPIAAWVHWALVFDEVADTAELWINGVSQGSKALVTQFNATPGNFEVGAFGTASTLLGRFAHIAAWANVKLSNAQIVALYNSVLAKAADQTGATGALQTTGASSSGSDYAYGPIAHLGTIDPTVRKPIVRFRGDSIAQGIGNSPDPTISFFDIALARDRVPYLKIAKGSERGQTAVTAGRSARRLALGDGANESWWEYDVNDYRTPTYHTVWMQVNALLGAIEDSASGAIVRVTTLTPGATSTDSWVSLTNQTPHAQDVLRVGYNDWVRAGCPCGGTTLAADTDLTAATIALVDASPLPAQGIVVIGGVPISYTAKSGNSLTGCAAITYYPQPVSGVTIPAGTLVLAPLGFVATLAGPTQTLPLATIVADSTVGFASSGTIYVGGQAVTYTGKTATSFTGCSGGSGAFGRYAIQQRALRLASGDSALAALPAGTLLAGQERHPISSYFEIADTVESSRNSGKWVVTGAANYATADGIHPAPAGHTLMSQGIPAGIAAAAFAA